MNSDQWSLDTIGTLWGTQIVHRLISDHHSIKKMVIIIKQLNSVIWSSPWWSRELLGSPFQTETKFQKLNLFKSYRSMTKSGYKWSVQCSNMDKRCNYRLYLSFVLSIVPSIVLSIELSISFFGPSTVSHCHSLTRFASERTSCSSIDLISRLQFCERAFLMHFCRISTAIPMHSYCKWSRMFHPPREPPGPQ